MGTLRIALAAALTLAALAAQEGPSEADPVALGPVSVTTGHPRLFLRPARLRLLKRERERESRRWHEFHAAVTGQSPMAEPGFAYALYYRVTGDAESGRKAIGWAINPSADLRQTALVFDWCQDLLTDEQIGILGRRLSSGIGLASPDSSISAVRSRLMAAIAVYDYEPEAAEKEMDQFQAWWTGELVPSLRTNREPLLPETAFALVEILHAIRDNAGLDPRVSLPDFFRALPLEKVMSYYPAAFQGPENAFRINMQNNVGAPDWRQAALSRTADLALVAYDNSLLEAQTLQGWLMQDRFSMRGPFGSPYEFLWANPYQPGLSYYNLPLAYHNPDSGKLFIRSGWQDSAAWFGLVKGVAKTFEKGDVHTAQLRAGEPLRVGRALVFSGSAGARFRSRIQKDDGPVFLIGLAPLHKYRLEIEGGKAIDITSDAGGIVELKLPHEKEVSVYVK